MDVVAVVGAAGAASAAAALQKRVAVARHAKVNGMRGGGGSVVIGGGFGRYFPVPHRCGLVLLSLYRSLIRLL